MKMIKFDLQMKGVKVTNLEELQEHFSAEILPIFQTGRLAKWFKSRDMPEQASAIDAIDKTSSELQQLKAICQVLELDDDEDVLQFLLDDRQVPQAAPLVPVAEVSEVESEEEPPVTEIAEDTNGVKEIKSFDSILCEFESSLNDKSNFYCGWGLNIFDKKISQKISNAVKSYAYPDEQEYWDNDEKYMPNGTLVLLVDNTTFGSGSEGLYVTENELYAKTYSGDRFCVKLKDITRIWLDEGREEITVNYSCCIKFFNSDSFKKMKIVVDCIRAYMAQYEVDMRVVDL